ncbi:MAG: 2-oxoacid:ferredoxin oxidoreductase subunit beta [Bacteroidales bacterium]|nr:2-oxoacid:ferredoxin oxidoreductase subunit beta [Bacteroidales bacterium]
MSEKQQLTFKDYKSDAEVRWCPGCGDIAILKAVQTAFAEMDIPKEKFAVISGIGCSSRFPYYMDTYGFHTIHGRAGAIASGVKTANPDLSVWQITGDGDALAIGGNHFIHEIRRNIDVNVLLFNNQIYGLTKGQYSPTSLFGQKTKTSPYGTVEAPFNPGSLSIGAGATFFARGIDVNVKDNVEILLEMEKHKGISIFEILQNCVIFNDGAHSYFTDRENKADRQLLVKHGEPMIFGKDNDKGLVLDDEYRLKVVNIGENGITKNDILIHDAHNTSPILHFELAELKEPVVLGVIRSVNKVSYHEAVYEQIEQVQATAKNKSMDDLLSSGSTWVVE